MQEILNTLKEWEDIVDTWSEDFENTFTHGEELINLYWSSSNMKVYFITEEGQHITDSFPIHRWFEWLRNHCPHCIQGYVQETGFQRCNHCNQLETKIQ
jgi:hypothetical protein